MARHHKIRIGTSGWHYPDWVGPFYEDGADSTAYLAQYAHHFEIVEVDAAMARSPSEELFDGWRQATPRGFGFVVQAPRSITHERILEGCRDDFRSFVEMAQGLANKLICVLLQFTHFTKQDFPSHKAFFDRLDRFLAAAGSEVPIAVEIRNRNWLNDEWFELLQKHHACTVLVDHPWLPNPAEAAEKWDVHTGPLVCVRLLGDQDAMEKTVKKWNRVTVDRSKDLPKVASLLDSLAETSDVVTLINNPYSGHAPATATEICAVMGRVSPISD